MRYYIFDNLGFFHYNIFPFAVFIFFKENRKVYVSGVHLNLSSKLALKSRL
jgi:hypothetical protein